MTGLELSLLLLAASVIAVAVLRLMQLPALLAYLLVGVAMGALVGDLGSAGKVLENFAHFGVVFLMFSIGLEFSLEKLKAMRRFVLGLGASQVGLTIIVGAIALFMLPGNWINALFLAPISWQGGLILAAATAMSSTALVAKILSERRELDTDHGRRVMAILLFQDLAVILLLVMLPVLADTRANWAVPMGLAAFKAACILLILFRFGRTALRKWFAVVARRKSHELFTLNVLLVTLFMAWLTQLAGLSLELGAFVAGILIAETEYRYQVEEDIKPFRDVLLGLFFIGLGAQLDIRLVITHWWVVLLLTIGPMAFKFGLVMGLARFQGANTTVSARTALYLAQAGEFGFVILTQALDSQIIAQPTVQIVLAAMLLSLLLSPILLQNSDRILLRVSNQEWLNRSLQLQQLASRKTAREKHVIICGFGRSGQSVAHVLETEKVPYVALDLDPDRVGAAKAAGENVVYGDAGRREILMAAGLRKASAIVVSVDDIDLSLRLLAMVKDLSPNTPVIVRTSDQTEIVRLRTAGATEVVPEVVEGSLLLASNAMVLAGVPLGQMQQRLASIRNDQYGVLNGFFHGSNDHEDAIEQAQLHLRTVVVRQGGAAVDKTVTDLALGPVRITAILRDGKRILSVPTTMVVMAGDTLVMSGSLTALADAQEALQA